MNDSLKSLKAAKSTSTRKTWSLTEVVGILSLIDQNLNKKEISGLTGRSVHSIQYKFFEGEIKGKEEGSKTIRSVKQYATMEALYASFDATFSQEDLDARLVEFNSTLNRTSEAAVS